MGKASESEQRFRHGCLLASGGKVVSLSCNASDRTVLAGRIMSSMHAEMMALSHAFRKKRWRKKQDKSARKNRNRHLDLYVVRLGYNDGLMSSKPCSSCIAALRQVGVKRVFYSQDGGGIHMEKVCDLYSSHASFHQHACHMRDFPPEKIRF